MGEFDSKTLNNRSHSQRERAAVLGDALLLYLGVETLGVYASPEFPICLASESSQQVPFQ
jgi:hypothetical protein